MFLLIDKSKGITSHDVVDKIRKITGERRIGHAGTLDPNASGLLIVGIGRKSTKKLGRLTGFKKEYLAEIILGEERDTDDILGKKIPNLFRTIRFGAGKFQIQKNYKFPKYQILNALKTFIGKQEQTPPAYSAIKIKGKKAYELARKGKDVKLNPRKITVYSIKLLSYKYPVINIKTEVSSGTYIRALARDIGRKLGCGAYLNNLRRTRIGTYILKNTVELDKLTQNNWEKYSMLL